MHASVQPLPFGRTLTFRLGCHFALFRNRPHLRGANLRFIPARAGNTGSRRRAWRWSTVHPRAGGEHPSHRIMIRKIFFEVKERTRLYPPCFRDNRDGSSLWNRTLIRWFFIGWQGQELHELQAVQSLPRMNAHEPRSAATWREPLAPPTRKRPGGRRSGGARGPRTASRPCNVPTSSFRSRRFLAIESKSYTCVCINQFTRLRPVRDGTETTVEIS